MTTPDNILSLHAHEEDLRKRSLDAIEQSDSLREHLSIVHESMAIIFSLAQEHVQKSDDELTIQYLGLRLFNAASSSLKLGLSGYYQFAFSIIRDIVETVSLIDYLGTNPEEIKVWKECDKKTRINKFGPGAIRNALNARDKLEGNRRKEIYDRLSEYSSHATGSSFQLLSPNGLGKIGPFFEEKYLQAWIEDIAKYLTHGGVIYIGHFKEVDLDRLIAKNTFFDQAKGWTDKYLDV